MAEPTAPAPPPAPAPLSFKGVKPEEITDYITNTPVGMINALRQSDMGLINAYIQAAPNWHLTPEWIELLKIPADARGIPIGAVDMLRHELGNSDFKIMRSSKISPIFAFGLIDNHDGKGERLWVTPQVTEGMSREDILKAAVYPEKDEEWKSRGTAWVERSSLADKIINEGASSLTLQERKTLFSTLDGPGSFAIIHWNASEPQNKRIVELRNGWWGSENDETSKNDRAVLFGQRSDGGYWILPQTGNSQDIDVLIQGEQGRIGIQYDKNANLTSQEAAVKPPLQKDPFETIVEMSDHMKALADARKPFALPLPNRSEELSLPLTQPEISCPATPPGAVGKKSHTPG